MSVKRVLSVALACFIAQGQLVATSKAKLEQENQKLKKLATKALVLTDMMDRIGLDDDSFKDFANNPVISGRNYIYTLGALDFEDYRRIERPIIKTFMLAYIADEIILTGSLENLNGYYKYFKANKIPARILFKVRDDLPYTLITFIRVKNRPDTDAYNESQDLTEFSAPATPYYQERAKLVDQSNAQAIKQHLQSGTINPEIFLAHQSTPQYETVLPNTYGQDYVAEPTIKELVGGQETDARTRHDHARGHPRTQEPMGKNKKTFKRSLAKDNIGEHKAISKNNRHTKKGQRPVGDGVDLEYQVITRRYAGGIFLDEYTRHYTRHGKLNEKQLGVLVKQIRKKFNKDHLCDEKAIAIYIKTKNLENTHNSKAICQYPAIEGLLREHR